MRLTLTRSGGFLGSALPPVVVDTASLAHKQQQHVERLVQAADFFTLPPMLMASQPGPDRFQYDLEIQDSGRRSHRVTFGEDSGSSALQDLARAIREVGEG